MLPILLAVMALTVFVIFRSRSTVVLGRSWPQQERVGYSAISHDQWDGLLRRFVNPTGHVDYASWKASPEDLRCLDDYLEQLSKLDAELEGNRAERIEFWVNAYNAMTVRGLIHRYPTSSIRDHTARLWGFNIWRDLRLIVSDNQYSLQDIENTILRPLKEPRIHFAIVCGSNGCPRLRNEAYSAEQLETQLQGNTQAFFEQSGNCAFNAERQELHLSPILKWYAADFGSTKSDVLENIDAWLPPEIRSSVQSHKVKLLYGDYDWSLNEQPRPETTLPKAE